MKIKYHFEGRGRSLDDIRQFPPEFSVMMSVNHIGSREDFRPVQLETRYVGGESNTTENGWTNGTATFEVVGLTFYDMWEED